MKFSIKDLFSNCKPDPQFPQFPADLVTLILNKFLRENFIFCAAIFVSTELKLFPKVTQPYNDVITLHIGQILVYVSFLS